jgi:adenine-specific DNA-methyltransferase
LEAGVLEVVSFDKSKNLVDVRYAELGERQIKTVWKRSRHDAGVYGSDFIKKVLGRTESFAFPKSIYSVEDAIIPMVLGKKNALILDFFAGSGTTYNAVALLNARDGGQRRSILVTNNEVESSTARRLQKKGIFIGDTEFEREGICESVTWPRCKNVTDGKSSDGKKLEGSYLGSDNAGGELHIGDGFKENIEYFHLDFLNPSDVERGDAFEGILPILWMIAGCIGEREDRRGSTPFYIAKHSPFAVLVRESHFAEFSEKLAERPDIAHAFLVTDSEENFALMRRELSNSINCYQLYKSYLENFRLNSADPSLMGQNA